MTTKVGINGFGRMGRLVCRAFWDWNEDIELIQINDPAGDAKTMAHLLEFDSVHNRWHHSVHANEKHIVIENKPIRYTQNRLVDDTDWSTCDIVIEASGKIKTTPQLQEYLNQGVKRVVVTAPVKEEGILNIVMGVNHDLYDKDQHAIVTAASCTTNCLAPIVKVLHEHLSIQRGSFTTVHDITNTQTILDSAHKDLRRARACGMSLIPTTTGSATAISHIFPELKGKLDGHAIRVPLANASLTDCAFEVNKKTTEQEINALFKKASETTLQHILGYEEKPLVSIDYKTDPRSCIIDALSTRVIDETHVKLYAWYDNEWGYANRTAELMRMIVHMDNP